MLNSIAIEQNCCSSSGRGVTLPFAHVLHSRCRVQCRVASQLPNTHTSTAAFDLVYKYPKRQCLSGCQDDDVRCLQVEALVQNVLRYPSLPARVRNWLPRLTQSVDMITDLVERMAEHYGNELTFALVSRQPCILDVPFETMLDRSEKLKQSLHHSEEDLPLLLKKEPRLLYLDSSSVKERFLALPRGLNIEPQKAHYLVQKYPTILLSPTHVLANKLAALRHLCSAREQWVRDVDEISVNMLAHFFRDSTDCLLRLEYLASTGERQEFTLRNVFKISNRNFNYKFQGYKKWSNMVKARRQQQKKAMRDQQMSAEAASIKEALQRASSHVNQE